MGLGWGRGWGGVWEGVGRRPLAGESISRKDPARNGTAQNRTAQRLLRLGLMFGCWAGAAAVSVQDHRRTGAPPVERLMKHAPARLCDAVETVATWLLVADLMDIYLSTSKHISTHTTPRLL